MRPALNAVRRALAAPARRVLGRWLHSTDGVLCLFPGWFAPPQPDWPSNHLQSGFPLFNDIATPKTMWHSMRISRPVNPGRVHGRFDTRRSRGIRARGGGRAARATGARGILLTPHDAAPDSDRLLVRRFVPMRTLLPLPRARASRRVGTAALAFEAGIAQVVTPFAHDQFDNAQRVAVSGCGVRVDGPVDGARLGAALARVLGEPSFAVHAARTRALLAAERDGCDAAADFIERFAPAHGRATVRPEAAVAGA